MPDYIDSSTIIDPLSENNFIKHKSEEIINKAIIFARELQEKTSKDVPIIGSFSICKTEKEIFYENYKKLAEKYEKIVNYYPSGSHQLHGILVAQSPSMF